MSKKSTIFPEITKNEDYVESWYPVIADLTFKTWIFKFTLDDGILLHRVASQTVQKKTITETDQESLNIFLSKVSNFFEKVKNETPPNSGYFLRLGSRSLKDAVLDSKSALKRMTDQLYQKYDKEYQSLNLSTKDDKISWVNQKSQMNDFLYIAECDTKSLRCTSISDMFELFFNSERVVEDLSKEIESKSPSFSLNFRLWDDRISYQFEFRGFVYHHKFCALTQYDRRLYFKQINENKEKILNAITNFYQNQVRPKMESNCPLPDGSYVIDFGVIFNNEYDLEVIVIEINRFSKEAGASLFHWVDDIDVLTGKKEFEFRLVEENQYNDVDYDYVLYPDLLMLKNQVKAKVVNDNKSLLERYLTWRNDVEPNEI